MKKLPIVLIYCLLLIYSCSSSDDAGVIEMEEEEEEIPDDTTSLYFPPIDSDIWETINPESLSWNEDELPALYDYLEEKGTKGFIILQDGKIAVEHYFNNHTQNADWTWFSAVKSLTGTAIGVAQYEGILDINNKTSDYLGNNWSSLTQAQQDQITVWHHLTMTTGLENNIGNPLLWTCTTPACMIYHVDPEVKWQYHQGAFTQLQHIITQSAGVDFKVYIKENILDRIGSSGSWSNFLGANIFSSNTRSMARFGLLSLNKGTWDEDVIVDEDYFNASIATSQNINKSYGYLWWLNGKESFMTPGVQEVFDGTLVPNGPSDMFAALGANDQKIYVIPSKNMVVVRCGEDAGNDQLANSSFDNELWQYITAVIN